MFRETDVPEAERLLEHSTDDPLLLADVDRQGADRLLFAMIRQSDGDIGRLQEAISQFRRDWRDLLVASDFADDPDAHKTWQPRRLAPDTVDRWMAGDLPTGVRFALNEPVEIRFGARRGTKGCVISLVGLEPEPRYLVELGSGENMEVRQFSLQAVG